jgi:hypothetical protein
MFYLVYTWYVRGLVGQVIIYNNPRVLIESSILSRGLGDFGHLADTTGVYSAEIALLITLGVGLIFMFRVRGLALPPSM